MDKHFTIIFAVAFVLAVLLESTVVQVPLTLIVLLLFFVIRKDAIIFPLSFGLGLLLDMFLFKPVGVSSIFFISFLFFVSLYDRKYEIRTLPFILLSSLLGSLLFALVMGYIHPVISLSLSMLFAIGFYSTIHFLTRFHRPR